MKTLSTISYIFPVVAPLKPLYLSIGYLHYHLGTTSEVQALLRYKIVCTKWRKYEILKGIYSDNMSHSMLHILLEMKHTEKHHPCFNLTQNVILILEA